ncbi:hypothetical protein JCM8208_003951 [Rhodotorula glutinis]
MRFTLATLALSLLSLGASTADAACHKVSRRSLAARNEQPAAPPSAPFHGTSSNKKVVRRQKGGARLNRQGGSWGGAGSASRASMTAAADGSGAPTPTAWSKSSSQTSKAAQATGSAGTASSSSSAAGSSASSSSSSSSSGSTYSGVATFFYQDGNAGACGSTHSDSDKIVALQSTMYGSGSYCGKTVVVTNTSNGKSVTATVADECPGCSTSESLDLSTGAFDSIGDEDTGELSISWSFSD